MADVSLDEPLGSQVIELQIAAVIEETADAHTLVFTTPDDKPVAPERLRYSPGQFLTLRVPSDRTGSVARCYSLSSSPFTDDRLAVTVKRTVGGYASNWLCDNAHPGLRMHALAPSGLFVPKTLDGDLLLVAAGSGITPMMSICRSALARGRGSITLIYANRDEESVIFAGALRELAAEHPGRLTVVHWLETVQGLPSAGALAALAAPYAAREAFICGPGPFMATAERALLQAGTPAERIHIEVFRSIESDPFAKIVIDDTPPADGAGGPATASVTLDGTTHQVRWPRSAMLLDVLLDAGLDAPYSCREGHCGACAVLVQTGAVQMEINDALDDSDCAEGLILACQARPVSDLVEVSYDD